MIAKNSSNILNLFFVMIIIFIIIATFNIFRQNDQTGKHTLIEGTIGTPKNLNPIIQNHNQSEGDIVALTFNGLFKLDNEGKPILDLAKNWEVTPDGRTYTIQIKDPIFWHDGNKLTTADISFTISYLRNNLDNSQNSSIWNEVEVFFINTNTVIFHLQEKFAPFLTYLTFPILPNHISANNYNVNSTFEPSNIVGTGPYIMQSYDNAQAHFRRNPSYHHGVPKIKEIKLKFFESSEEMLTGANQGLFDSSIIMLSKKISINELSDYKTTKYPMGQSTILFMNNAIEPFNELINRQYISELLHNKGFFTDIQSNITAEIIAGNSIHPVSWAGREFATKNNQFTKEHSHRHDHDHDHEHIERPALNLIVPQDMNLFSIAENIKKELSKEKIKVNIKKLSNDENFALELANRNFHFALLNISESADPDPYYIWHTSQTLAPGLNISGVNDFLLDNFIEQGRISADMYERLAIYNRFQARFDEIKPSIILAHPVYTYVTKKSINGPESAIIYNLSQRFKNIHNWEITTKQG
ncbi:MAG: hypothetical protein CL872_01120 [Dehalococcoidaceae bacterium]|nr:hypothetical protein [Dehalococcoidaceae bacterium]|tara:strand:- start:617 stop:2200 length:1584 start_codon:yes stop_codon:yes gene_type:complete